MNNNLQQILELKQQGLSSRKIGKLLGIGKSTVNDTINRSREIIKKGNARILFLDVETAPDVAVSFSRFKTNLSQDHVLHNGGWLISIAWRWSDETEVQGLSLTPYEAIRRDDLGLVARLYELFEQADILCGHNLDNFDLPIIRSRMVTNGFPVHKSLKTLDTLKMARTMKFQSNKLDSLGNILGVGAKVKHSGISLWVRCLHGEQDALDEMLKYNKGDIDLLVDVYMKLRAYDPKHTNIGLYNDADQPVCRVCGSLDLTLTGNSVYTQVSEFEEHSCNNCGARQRSRKAINTKEQRSNLML